MTRVRVAFLSFLSYQEHLSAPLSCQLPTKKPCELSLPTQILPEGQKGSLGLIFVWELLLSVNMHFNFSNRVQLVAKKSFNSFFLFFFKLKKARRLFYKKPRIRRKLLKKTPFFRNLKIYRFFKGKSKKPATFNFFFYFLLLWFVNYLPKLNKKKKPKQKVPSFLMPTRLQSTFLQTLSQANVLRSTHFNSFVAVNYRDKFKYKMYMLQKKIVYLNFIKYFTFFIANFLEQKFRKPFFIMFKFFKNTKTNQILRRQHHKLLKHQFRIGQGFFLNEMLYVIWTALKKKDLFFLVTWIKRTMERIRWKKQKSFLLSLRLIFKTYISPYFAYLKCYGYKCIVWGKIGVSGNAKTRNFVFKNKQYSLTTKMYRLDYDFNIINTHTGVLGISFYLLF